LTLKEIETIESKKISLHEKQKILVNYDEEYIKKISNPSKELKKIVRLNQEKRLCNSKPYDGGHYSWNGSSCEFNPRVEPSTPDYSYESDNSNSGGSYSNQSSGCRIQTVYVPGSNGRKAQTRICN
jgi:hypothetical protein